MHGESEPPYSMQAEQSVLGSILLAGDKMADVADVVVADDFYRRDHAKIFAAMLSLDSAGKGIDLTTVSAELEDDDEVTVSYLAEMAQQTPAPSVVRHYAEIVRDRSHRRKLMKSASEILQAAQDKTISEAMELAQSAVMGIGGPVSGGAEAMKDVLRAYLSDLDERYQNGGGAIGVKTGLCDIDKIIGAMAPGDLNVLAARPSMGKTSLALKIAATAGDNDGPVLVWSGEMPSEQLVSREVSRLSRISGERLRDANLDDDDWAGVSAAVARLSQSRVHIDDTPALAITELRARARRFKHRHGLALMVVDYLQLMRSPGTENRTQEISEISRGLKALAKECDCPVLALSQLNRNLESRPDKRPRMSDLRESGAIEQDADVIMFLYRDTVYNDDAPSHIAELEVAKARNGPTGRAVLYFDGSTQHWGDLDEAAIADYTAMKREPAKRSPRNFDDFSGGKDAAAGS